MANFCTKCGKPLDECTCPKAVNSSTFDSVGFIASMKNRMGIGEPETNVSDTYERGMKIVPDSIQTNDGEIPVKQYDVAVLRSRLKFMRAEGRLQITNKRLLFRATGRSIMGRTALQHEFSIDEIGGIEIRKDYRFGFFEIVVGLAVISGFTTLFSAVDIGTLFSVILGLAGVVPFFLLKRMFFIKILTCALSFGSLAGSYMHDENAFIVFLAVLSGIVTIIALFLFCFKRNLILAFKTKGATGAVEIRRKKGIGIFGLLFGNNASEKEEYTGYSEVLPAKDTETAIREIGALISDIQKLGDFGVEKWKVN